MSAAPTGDEVTALLLRARRFIERGWCRSTLARNRWGSSVNPVSEQATAWCANGALVAAGLPWTDFIAYQDHPAVHLLSAAIDGEWIPTFNNRQETVEPVLAAFDRAIAAAGGVRREAAAGREG